MSESMNGYGEHVPEERLNDWAEGLLSDVERRGVDRHLAACASCRADGDSLRALLARVRKLPASIEPERDLWHDIAAASAAGAREPRSVVRQLPARTPRRMQPWMLAAAAVLLVATSSLVTALIVRRPAGSAPVAQAPAPTASPETPASLAAFVATEAQYRSATDELLATIRAQRTQLAPGTLATLERNLRVIDEAIRESREALERDPANQALVDLLGASWEQKLDLLRRTSALAVGS